MTRFAGHIRFDGGVPDADALRRMMAFETALGMALTAYSDPKSGIRVVQSGESGPREQELGTRLITTAPAERAGGTLWSPDLAGTPGLAESFLAAQSHGFACMFLDHAHGCVNLAVDHFATDTLFYHLGEDGLIFATDFERLLAHPEVPVKARPQDIAWKSAMRMDAAGDRTWFAGIRCVRPGRIVRIPITGGSATEVTYWRPPAASTFDPQDGEAAAHARIRAAFDVAVDRRIPPDNRAAVMLSGGFDSSVVAAACKARGMTLDLYHVVYDGADAEQNGDLDYARIMADALNRPLTVLTVDLPTMLETLNDLVTALGRPLVHGAEFGMWLFYRRVAAEGGRVVFAGHASDSIWGGQEGDYPTINNVDFTAECHNPQYLAQKLYQNEQPFWHDFLAQKLYPGLGVTPRQVAALIWEHGFHDYREFRTEEPAKKGRVHQLAGISNYIGQMTAAMAGRFGLHEEKVFLDRAFVELAFGFPMHFLNHAGPFTDKPLLKAALRDLVPEPIVTRRKVGFQPPRDSTLLTDYRAYLARTGLPDGIALSRAEIEALPMTTVLYLDSLRRWQRIFIKDRTDEGYLRTAVPHLQ